MAFEIAHSQPQFGTFSPVRRLLALLLGLAFLAGLVWSCITAYHAKPVGPAPGKTMISPGADPRAT
jgi:hypothetical protein